MHVYHYAPYETTAMKRLAGRYATRESQVDQLLRGSVFVDLYRVVRQGRPRVGGELLHQAAGAALQLQAGDRPARRGREHCGVRALART